MPKRPWPLLNPHYEMIPGFSMDISDSFLNLHVRSAHPWAIVSRKGRGGSRNMLFGFQVLRLLKR